MKSRARLASLACVAACGSTAVAAEPADPRLREVVYDPRSVVTVPVKRGVVTLVVLDADEAITEVAAGLGGDCTKADAAWCVAAESRAGLSSVGFGCTSGSALLKPGGGMSQTLGRFRPSPIILLFPARINKRIRRRRRARHRELVERLIYLLCIAS